MKLRASVVALVLAAGCGRSQPFRYVDDSGFEDPLPRPDGQRDCPWDVQTFTLPPVPKPKVDVLLVVDDSGSMGDDQEVLASNFSSFIAAFQGSYVDYHLGAITTDMVASNRSGRLVGPFLTQDTPNIAQAFRSMVVQGSNGSSDERGLQASRLALSDPLASNENKGFLRPEADLALIILTDETDHSNIPASQFTAFLQTLKSPPAKTSVVAILGLGWYFLCEKLTYSWPYAEVARSFGANGMVVACTSEFAKRMEEMGGRIVNARCVVELQRPFENGKPQVTLNGSPIMQKRWVRIVPHVVETLLLISALALAYTINQYPFVDAWLTAKIGGLVLYVGFGYVALSGGMSKTVSFWTWMAAQAAFFYIVLVAITHDPSPW